MNKINQKLFLLLILVSLLGLHLKGTQMLPMLIPVWGTVIVLLFIGFKNKYI